MFNKKLEKRIGELDDMLGVIYQEDKDYQYHATEKDGFWDRVGQLLEKAKLNKKHPWD